MQYLSILSVHGYKNGLPAVSILQIVSCNGEDRMIKYFLYKKKFLIILIHRHNL